MPASFEVGRLSLSLPRAAQRRLPSRQTHRAQLPNQSQTKKPSSFEAPPVTKPKTRPRVGASSKYRHVFQVPAGHNAQDSPARGRQWEIQTPLSSPRRPQRPRLTRAWAAVGYTDTSFKSPPVTTPKTRPRVGASSKYRHVFQVPACHNAQDSPARGRQWEIQIPLSSPRRSQRPRLTCAWAAVGYTDTSFKSPPVTTPKTRPRVGASGKYRHVFQVPAGHNARKYTHVFRIPAGLRELKMMKMGGSYLLPPLYSGGNKSASSRLRILGARKGDLGQKTY